MAEEKIQTISWTSPEYIQKERSIDWFWTVGLVSILGAIGAIYFSNYMFAILILLSGGMMFLLSIHTPKEIEYSLFEDGMKAGDKTYRLKQLKYFDFRQDKDSLKLIIQTDGKFMPFIISIIKENMREDLEKELSKVAERKEMEESFSVKFADMIGL